MSDRQRWYNPILYTEQWRLCIVTIFTSKEVLINFADKWFIWQKWQIFKRLLQLLLYIDFLSTRLVLDFGRTNKAINNKDDYIIYLGPWEINAKTSQGWSDTFFLFHFLIHITACATDPIQFLSSGGLLKRITFIYSNENSKYAIPWPSTWFMSWIIFCSVSHEMSNTPIIFSNMCTSHSPRKTNRNCVLYHARNTHTYIRQPLAQSTQHIL